jgi:hypothetical protein
MWADRRGKAQLRTHSLDGLDGRSNAEMKAQKRICDGGLMPDVCRFLLYLLYMLSSCLYAHVYIITCSYLAVRNMLVVVVCAPSHAPHFSCLGHSEYLCAYKWHVSMICVSLHLRNHSPHCLISANTYDFFYLDDFQATHTCTRTLIGHANNSLSPFEHKPLISGHTHMCSEPNTLFRRVLEHIPTHYVCTHHILTDAEFVTMHARDEIFRRESVCLQKAFPHTFMTPPISFLLHWQAPSYFNISYTEMRSV